MVNEHVLQGALIDPAISPLRRVGAPFFGHPVLCFQQALLDQRLLLRARFGGNCLLASLGRCPPDIECARRRILGEDAVPSCDHGACLFGVWILGRPAFEERCVAFGMERISVLLDMFHVFDRELLVCGDLLVQVLMDARDAGDVQVFGRVVEDRRPLEVCRLLRVVVGGRDIAAGGVVRAGKIAPAPLPFIFSCAGDGQPPGKAVAVGRIAGDLQRNIPLFVAANHIVRGQGPGHCALEEILAARGLRQLQGAPERRRALLLVGRPGGEGNVLCLVFVKDRTVLGIFQFHHPRLVLAFDLDLFVDDFHRHPGAVELRLVGIVGVGLLDIGVHLVNAREGHAPRHILIVAQIYPDKGWLAAADHMPAGRVQFYEISQRGHFDGAVRIVRNDRKATGRELAADHPIVATVHVLHLGHQARRLLGRHQRMILCNNFRRRQLARREGITFAFAGGCQRVVRNPVQVEPLRDFQIIVGIGGGAPVGFRGAKLLDVQRQLKFCARPRTCAVNVKLRPAQGHRFRRPGRWLDAGQFEFHRQIVGVGGDIGVKPVGPCREQLLRVGVIAGPFLRVPWTPEHHQAGARIVINRLGAKDFRKPAFTPAAPHLQLPEAILRHHITLREEHILLVLGEDVGNALLVADDVHWLLQSGDLQISIYRRQRLTGQYVQRCRCAWCGAFRGALRCVFETHRAKQDEGGRTQDAHRST